MGSHTRTLYATVSLGKQFYKQTSAVRVSSLQLEFGVQQREQMGNAALKSQLLRLDLSSFLCRSHNAQLTYRAWHIAVHLFNIREKSSFCLHHSLDSGLLPHTQALFSSERLLQQVEKAQELWMKFNNCLDSARVRYEELKRGSFGNP